MKEMGCEEQIPKLEENQIDAATFWGLEDGDLKDVIEIKSYGKRKSLLKRMNEIKAEREKEMEEKHKKEKSVNKDDVKTLLQQGNDAEDAKGEYDGPAE